ncbi:MAG: agmatinase [Pseudomonadota bacterium]
MSKDYSDLAFRRDDLKGTIAEPTYAGALSFMRRRYSRDTAAADVAVVGVPFDLGTTNRPGARLGPRAIRAASSTMGWDRTWGWAFDPFDELAVVDYGDCLFDHGAPTAIPAQLADEIGRILAKDCATLVLGGDHFVSYPSLQAHAKKHGPLSLIHFDAHSDTWRRESDRLDHGSMFWYAANEGLVVPERSAQIGIRTHNDETHGFNIFSADDVEERGTDAIVRAVHDIVGPHPCYVTFDIDCLDPAFAPGTGTPVVGGLSSATARRLLRGLAGIDVRGMDVVEVAPAYDHAEITALAGAAIAMDLLALFAVSQRR